MPKSIRGILEDLSYKGANYHGGVWEKTYREKDVTHAESQIKVLMDEDMLLDFLDSWGYRHGNMLKCSDDDFRKIAHAIKEWWKEK